MRVLLDECLPRRLKRELVGHEVETVPEAGWAGKKNGELLRLAGGTFAAFITIDRRFASGHSRTDLSSGVIMLQARATESRICSLWCQAFSMLYERFNRGKSSGSLANNGMQATAGGEVRARHTTVALAHRA